MALTKTQKQETTAALETINKNLHSILADGSSWCASSCLRLLIQLTKRIKPLIET